MDESRLKLLEEWYKNHETPSVEGHVKELVEAVRKSKQENLWLYGKLNIISETIERGREESQKF